MLRAGRVSVFGAILIAAAQTAAERPNIVFIVADDMGYADCGVQGCKDVQTPHLDSIAAAGVRFTSGYTSGTVCSPTRTGLMTGRYHYRDGVHDWIPPGKTGMNTDVPTIAGYLQRAGYHTGVVGKWHLGEQPERHPQRRGFDAFFGFLGGGRSYFPVPPKAEQKTNTYTQIMRGVEPVKEPEYTTHGFGQEAAAFIERQKGQSRPFFLYLCFNAVHTPMHAPEDYLARFGSIEDNKRRTYAGMLAAMDDNIGKVLQALRSTGVEDKTLLCFISDNGGPITRNAPNGSRNTPLRGGKGETWEGGIRVPFFVKWPGKLPPGSTYDRPVIQMDLTATALAAAGVTADAKWPLDGVDLIPCLANKSADPHNQLCWSYETQFAIRRGDWKLTLPTPPKGGTAAPHLTDLAHDIGEQNNLASAQPERVKEMQSAWSAWRAEVIGTSPSVKP